MDHASCINLNPKPRRRQEPRRKLSGEICFLSRTLNEIDKRPYYLFASEIIFLSSFYLGRSWLYVEITVPMHVASDPAPVLVSGR